MAKENAVVKKEANAIAVASEVNDMFGGGSSYQIPIDAPLPILEILRETPQFKTPDGETVKDVTGHILYWHHANQYWDTEFGKGESGPPTCASSDGLSPDGGETPLKDPCRVCPKNEYDSAPKGNGKACQNTIRLYVLLDGDVIPCVIKASPASLSNKESLLKWLTNAPNITAKAGVGTKYQPIKVKFSLHKKDFSSGFSASVLDLETVTVLTPANDLDELKKLAGLYSDFMTNYIGRIKEDVAAEHTEPVEEAVSEGKPAVDPDVFDGTGEAAEGDKTPI